MYFLFAGVVVDDVFFVGVVFVEDAVVVGVVVVVVVVVGVVVPAGEPGWFVDCGRGVGSQRLQGQVGVIINKYRDSWKMY